MRNFLTLGGLFFLSSSAMLFAMEEDPSETRDVYEDAVVTVDRKARSVLLYDKQKDKLLVCGISNDGQTSCRQCNFNEENDGDWKPVELQNVDKRVRAAITEMQNKEEQAVGSRNN